MKHIKENSLLCHICSNNVSCKSCLVDHLMEHELQKPNIVSYIKICDRLEKYYVFKPLLKLIPQVCKHVKRNKINTSSVRKQKFNLRSDRQHHSRESKKKDSKSGKTPNNKVTSFHQELLLKSNNSVLSDEKPFKCEICNQQFSKKPLLICHEMSHGHDIKILMYKCQFCEEVFYCESHLIFHMKYHYTSATKECSTCDQVFKNESFFQLHKCLKLYKIYECSVCKQEFNDKLDCELHLHWHKKMDLESEMTPYYLIKSFQLKPLIESKNSVLSNEQPFECETCNQQFSNKSLLTCHEMSHIKILKYECDICKKVFNQKSHLTFHMRLHSVVKKKECPTCNGVFKNKALLQSHKCLKLYKIYECSVCKKEFNEELDWELHLKWHKIKNLDREMTPYCQVKSFYQVPLLEYDNSLKDKQLFKCEACNQCFSKKSLLIQHEMSHEDITMYICDICKEVFHQKSHISLHMKYHIANKIEECALCNRVFKKKSLLQSHKCPKLYKICNCSQTKLFKCTLCPMEYVTSSQLISHLNTHINEKLFQCKICNKRFNLEATLRYHMKIHKA